MELTTQPLLIIVFVGIVIWLVTDRLLAWAVPSSESGALVPAVAGAFVGLLWSRQLAQDPSTLSDVIGAAAGCFVVLYLVITIATPGHASAVINCRATGPLEEGFKQRYPGPWAWPYQMVVTNRGSVVWYVRSEIGLRVTIRFPKGSPFEQTAFEAVIEADRTGTIVAAPVVRSGGFEYEIMCVDGNGSVFKVDPKLKIPRGRRGGDP